jgi:hypothetical protein
MPALRTPQFIPWIRQDADLYLSRVRFCSRTASGTSSEAKLIRVGSASTSGRLVIEAKKLLGAGPFCAALAREELSGCKSLGPAPYS